MSLIIQEVFAEGAPMELLLLADPSEDKIRSYLSDQNASLLQVVRLWLVHASYSHVAQTHMS